MRNKLFSSGELKYLLFGDDLKNSFLRRNIKPVRELKQHLFGINRYCLGRYRKIGDL